MNIKAVSRKIRTRQAHRFFSIRAVFFLAALLPFTGITQQSKPGDQRPQAGDISPATYEVSKETIKIPMRDGVEIKGDLFRPEAEGRFPVILQMVPYGRGIWAGRSKRYATHGYVVLNTDVRGRYGSGGEWDPFSPKHKTDGFDLVQWIAEQPWCNGKVGTRGASYLGWTQWWTASQTPPALKAIVPEVAPPDQFYNMPYQNGVLLGWALDWGALMSGSRQLKTGPGPYGGWANKREEDFGKLPYIDFDKTRDHQETTWWRKWIKQNTSSGAYWRAIAYQTPESYAQIKVPSLAITGWFDADFPGTPMNYLGMKEHGGSPAARRPRIVIGPWAHNFNRRVATEGVNFGSQQSINWDGYVMRWFDYHLKGIDNGVLENPPVHVFVMGRNKWRAAEDWPLPQTQFTKYYLHSGGKAGAPSSDGILSTEPPADEPADKYVYDPNNPTPSAAFANGHIDGPRDISKSAKRSDVLVYDTPELSEDVEIVGPISVKLFAASSASDTDWMIRLSDVQPDGRALFLAEGVMRARYRDPEKNGEFNPKTLSDIEPNQAYEYTIQFWRSTGNLFAKGHRIRIEISSSYYPFYLRNPNTDTDNVGLATKFQTAKQTIFHDAERSSHILLPVIPATESP